MVEFLPEKAARACTGRNGLIKRWAKREFPDAHCTPSYMLYTRAGHIPHLTWRLVERHLKFRQQPILQFTLPSMVDLLNRVSSSDSSIFNVPDKFIRHLSPLDPLGKRDSGYNNQNAVSIWVKNCRLSLTSDRFVAIVQRLQTDSFSTLFDYDTPKDAQCKRMLKSVLRSLALSGELCTIEEPLPVVSLGGGFSSAYRQRFAKDFILKGASTAFSIDLSAFSSNKLIEGREPFDESEIRTLVSNMLAMLPETSLRLVEGAFSPAQICFLAGLGVDLFDSSYAILLAEEGKAFQLGSDFPSTAGDYAEIDFNDKRYFDDFSGVTDGCDCYSCTNYTKAYLQHLINTKEMLARILLVTHNLAEFDKMFERLRTHYKEVDS